MSVEAPCARGWPSKSVVPLAGSVMPLSMVRLESGIWWKSPVPVSVQDGLPPCWLVGLSLTVPPNEVSVPLIR
jgi:hypothetical protein